MDEAGSEPRALEILDSVKTIFASKGFDGASMQDLARAAGMSAGNFYRYFPSKSAIVEGLVEREFAEVRARFAEVIASPDPRAAFREMVRRRLEEEDEDAGALWCEMEAAANRRPEFAALLDRTEGEIIDNLIAVLARIAGIGQAEARARFRGHARLIALLVTGAANRCGGRGGAADGLPALVLRVVDALLSEISAGGPVEPAAAANA